MIFAGVPGWVRRAAHGLILFAALACPEVSPGVVVQNSVTLAWDVSTDPTVAGYKVYYGTNSRNYTNSVNAGNTNTATILNLATGVTYYFAATTYNTNNLESTYSAETTFALVNPAPPTLAPISSMVMNENAGLQNVNLTGISSGSSNLTQALTVTAFSSNPSIVPNPTVIYSSPNPTGVLTFAPVTNAFGQVTMTVMVDNGNTVSNTVIRTFTVTVNPVNNPPTLDAINNLVLNENASIQTVNLTGISSGATNEFQPLTIIAVSSNPTLIPNPTVVYTSPNPTGTLSFTPVANTFGGATVTVSVNDGQSSNNITAQSFVVTVNQVIAPPTPITNFTITPYSSLHFVLAPPFTNNDQITYSVGAGAPAGTKIVTRRGISSLNWTPTSAQSSSTNNITVVITDSTNPTLSTNEAVQVIVLDYLAVSAGFTNVLAGNNLVVPLYLVSSDLLTNITFNIGWPTNRFRTPSLGLAWPGAVSNSVTVQGTNLQIRLSAQKNQPMQGSNLLGQLSFQTIAGQGSAFVPLPVSIASGIKSGGLLFSNYVSAAGRVVYVSDVPLLEANNAGGRSLSLYGKPGTNYQLQFSTNYGANASWYPLMSYSQTNTLQPTSLGSSSPMIVYRLLQQ